MSNQTPTEEKLDKQEVEQDELTSIKETGELNLTNPNTNKEIHLMTIIGEIEGHDALPSQSKATKYEHLLPQLVKIENSKEIDGLLILLNTTGGDIDAGLSLAEMISSLSKPSVSLVLGGSHSIGVPLAVSTDYSFIVPTGTMLIHPVRMNGSIIAAPQTYDYFKRTQDRITGFISRKTGIPLKHLEELMLNTGELTKDLGTIFVGEEAVSEGLIKEVGGIKEALKKLQNLIKERK